MKEQLGTCDEYMHKCFNLDGRAVPDLHPPSGNCIDWRPEEGTETPPALRGYDCGFHTNHATHEEAFLCCEKNSVQPVAEATPSAPGDYVGLIRPDEYAGLILQALRLPGSYTSNADREAQIRALKIVLEPILTAYAASESRFLQQQLTATQQELREMELDKEFAYTEWGKVQKRLETTRQLLERSEKLMELRRRQVTEYVERNADDILELRAQLSNTRGELAAARQRIAELGKRKKAKV